MPLTTPFPTQDPGGIPIEATRRALGGMVVQSAAGVHRAGVFPSGAGALVTGRPSMAYDISPFQAATSRKLGGVEFVTNDGVATVPTDAAPTANSRIDVIYVLCRYNVYADSVNVPTFGVARGAAAPSPVKPTLPEGALELATAVVTSADTTTATVVITQTAQFTAMAGGVVNVRNSAQLDAWAPANGGRAFRMDNSVEYVRVRGAWVATDTGEIIINPNGGWSALQALSVRVRNGMASLNGRLDAGSGATVNGFQLPAEARPAVERVTSVMTSSNLVQTLIIQPTGNVVFFNLSLPASDYRMASVPPWPVTY
ncbi:hypothetical protein SK224_08385 [Microbacterium sp. BG28]|uniref:hypothetical protein n=1 Tax=Microbacterium sp. BG28 TaxID=3097356 RepID=UPI002A5A6C77|nr:hypothetical protein [Microbacterium sp. BG28]MDY0829142.1 hypothetical protein [Microbacterium sp. BG28]